MNNQNNLMNRYQAPSKIGSLTLQERKAKIEKFKEKRKNRM